MMLKQIKYRDLDNDTVHGGIMLDNGNVICACCGCLISKDRFTDKESYELIETYKDWVDFSESIID